ncbi:MAG: hypothetical protein RhofKO_17990 [Rhodothermales bacterium]
MTKRTWGVVLGGAAVIALLIVFWPGEATSQSDLIINPQRGPFVSMVTTTGELKAKNSVGVYATRRGQRHGIYEMKVLNRVPEGTIVEQGDFVAALDPSDLSSKLREAQLNLEQAQSQFIQTQLDTTLTMTQNRDELVDLRYAMEEAEIRKDQSIYESPSVQRQAQIDYEKSKRTYDRSVSNYVTKVRQAEAQMAEVAAERSKAQQALDELVSLQGEFTIMAPERGMVIYRNEWGRSIDMTIRAWDPLVATLPDLSVMESITYINEVDIQKIQRGQEVEIGLDAMPDLTLTGTVTDIANVGSSSPTSDAKVFEVKIEIAETDSTLRPAMTTSNSIVTAEIPDVLRVPLETIHVQDSLRYVFKRDGRGTVRQEILLGQINENEAVIEAGLSESDELYLSVPTDTTGLPFRRLGTDETVADAQ